DLALAKAQARDIEVKLGRTEIKAPQGGIVSRRTARLGATASMLPQTEPLFRIIADGAVELEAQVAEVDIPSLKVGQPVAVTPAGANQALNGSIRLISPEVDKASRLGRVRVALDGNPAVAIGSFARGVIKTGRKSAVTLPLSAITYGRAGATVQTVSEGKVATRKVELGLTGAGRAEIASGIAEGQTVVARAGTFVRDGDSITPIPTDWREPRPCTSISRPGPSASPSRRSCSSSCCVCSACSPSRSCRSRASPISTCRWSRSRSPSRVRHRPNSKARSRNASRTRLPTSRA